METWEVAHKLVLDIYKITTSFPRSESFGVTDQLRRAAYSVPANIVEGQSRNTCNFFTTHAGLQKRLDISCCSQEIWVT